MLNDDVGLDDRFFAARRDEKRVKPAQASPDDEVARRLVCLIFRSVSPDDHGVAPLLLDPYRHRLSGQGLSTLEVGWPSFRGAPMSRQRNDAGVEERSDVGLVTTHQQSEAARTALTEPLANRFDVTSLVGFREFEGPGAWRVDVVVHGVVYGHIDRGDGVYRYFEGPLNDVTWSCADRDLERLQARIQATMTAEGLEVSRPVPPRSPLALAEPAWT